ncbi:ABC transporter substrate-binding protein [Rhodoplanes sp. Z2-YC6860]|uniref:ABC transporter substrate-binding protein n=1 Tax=Rhodoplanes sp. Z2-YC6860 TaxID=674703 RepID=UPI00078D045B|nr:ABC transporter substrate-binding protein [Rhodoplanes sp. Z2-YC6860]AMN43505.1 branched-chain amino acid transport system substrate-binding protein [Rhodoplanes sp. Z2-YC6860]
MSRKPFQDSALGGNSITRRAFTAGAAAASLVASPAILRAQGGALKVGVLLPRSGAQAGIGQDCFRGVELAAPIFKELGLPELQIMNADTETNVEVARARAEKLIADGAQLLVGAFDSGQSSAIAQVAEQKGIPFVINIAAAPPITEQGYKFVFRNFPTGPVILADAFTNQKEIFAATGSAPKSVAFLCCNDTFGTSMLNAIPNVLPKFDMPYKIIEQITYDPTARDLSVEVTKAKASGAEGLLVVSRLNDAILLTRELVKQRWSPMAILSMGPGWYEDQYFKTLGKLSDGPLSFVPWYDPTKKLTKRLEGELGKKFPGVNLNTNHVYTFEALLVAADAYKRAKSTDPHALADAIRSTNITDNVSTGPGIQFNAKGQNDKLKNSAIQNRGGKLVTVAPKAAANAKVEWPLKPYDKRS